MHTNRTTFETTNTNKSKCEMCANIWKLWMVLILNDRIEKRNNPYWSPFFISLFPYFPWMLENISWYLETVFFPPEINCTKTRFLVRSAQNSWNLVVAVRQFVNLIAFGIFIIWINLYFFSCFKNQLMMADYLVKMRGACMKTEKDQENNDFIADVWFGLCSIVLILQLERIDAFVHLATLSYIIIHKAWWEWKWFFLTFTCFIHTLVARMKCIYTGCGVMYSYEDAYTIRANHDDNDLSKTILHTYLYICMCCSPSSSISCSFRSSLPKIFLWKCYIVLYTIEWNQAYARTHTHTHTQVYFVFCLADINLY